MSSIVVPISALPLPPLSQHLTRNLTPDPEATSPADFRSLLAERPSVQRRSHLLADDAHFSYVAPCPLPFPFHIAAPADGAPILDQAAYVEKWLAEREPQHERPKAPSAVPGALRKYYPEKRDTPRVLVALSERALRDCVPHLSVGDALATLGTPSLVKAYGDDAVSTTASDEDVAAREELVDVVSGQAVLMNTEGDPEMHWAPWALRYSGHQFGQWAGQLGDGRAISICESSRLFVPALSASDAGATAVATPHPEKPELVYELQLKGAGRTPFSRFADGLAVLRSSIREFLCSEGATSAWVSWPFLVLSHDLAFTAMHALGIPTSRALTLVSLPAIPVHRERTESACILTRLAPSFIRIGSFEALNPPDNIRFVGGGQQDAHLDALRVLGEFVGRNVLRLEGVRWSGGAGNEPGEAWGKELVLEVARRNGRMVAGWQAYGFMHGVINTDNVSVLGLTIDYGPYAFMDVFDSFRICNHDDHEGRYSYKFQPNAVVFALRALVNALAPLIGAEAELGHSVSQGWTNDVSPDKLSEWRKKGIELTKDDMERVAQQACADEYGLLMHKRLGLRRLDSRDEAQLSRPLLDLMYEHKLDFHGTFRRLVFFRPSAPDGARDAFISSVLKLCGEPQIINREKATKDLGAWLTRYAARIEEEREEWLLGQGEEAFAEREHSMKTANPRFVLRQWVLEEVIRHVEQDVDSGKRLLDKVLQMACNPFDAWGAEAFEGDESTLDAETREERRYCSLGDRKFLGFQCSCSS
ncbi:uncharacterized protein FIBRA_00172 [Fibroporia radiculosa]|uniref:Selenoprotein O n=1 Tax=Fibroporia radiculosa TaxID=599839 RepID=J7SCK2_9APHY|nr:uncharacterized protein FIBRA_00172 [Fibroporia radiculosa]CCL98178.1 predicted protein [Fibroporia radiculosa]